jgi:hypothetical protein
VPVTFCVLLWARDGQGAQLAGYEDRVLELVVDHEGEVLQRVRGDGANGQPLEVQLIRFASSSGYESYLADERRQAMAAERDRVVERTELMRVAVVS